MKFTPRRNWRFSYSLILLAAWKFPRHPTGTLPGFLFFRPKVFPPRQNVLKLHLSRCHVMFYFPRRFCNSARCNPHRGPRYKEILNLKMQAARLLPGEWPCKPTKIIEKNHVGPLINNLIKFRRRFSLCSRKKFCLRSWWGFYALITLLFFMFYADSCFMSRRG